MLIYKCELTTYKAYIQVFGEKSIFRTLVEPVGIEPTTSWMQTRR
ncbi:uncharacterized protein METZ01_LOCUS155977, partial [marine metagenome]